MESSGKCCKGFNTIILVLMLVNTFFIGSIWCKMVIQCPKSKMCSLSAQKGVKICPLTGKVLEEPKGSMTE